LKNCGQERRWDTCLEKDYFRGRLVSVNTARRSMDCGCPQGLVLGPLLWNVVYDRVLNLLRDMGVLLLFPA